MSEHVIEILIDSDLGNWKGGGSEIRRRRVATHSPEERPRILDRFT